jgi:hypothetical protein
MEKEQEEVLDEATSSSDDTEEQNEDSVDIEFLQNELEKERQARQQLTARAKKAEEALKALSTEEEKKEEKKENASPSNVEEVVLRANGMSDELLKQLKAVAQVRNVSLIDAQKDELFVAIKEKYEQEQKVKDASLGASKGSGQQKAKKTFNTPGLSPEDHKKLWQQNRN